MSLSVIPLTILGQITGVTGSGDTVLYQVSFKSIDGTPLYGVTAVWSDEQAVIEALAAEKPYGVWINPIDGTFTVKFAGYTYVGTADLTDADVLAGVTPIEFMTTEVSDKLLPDVTAADDNKGMFVENGEWTLKDVPYTLTTTFFSGNAPVVDLGSGSYGFNLGQIEGLDSSVKTVTVTVEKDDQINTYTLTYVDNDDVWADLGNTLGIVDGNFHLHVVGITDSNLGEVYNINLSSENLEPNFKAAVEEAITENVLVIPLDYSDFLSVAQGHGSKNITTFAEASGININNASTYKLKVVIANKSIDFVYSGNNAAGKPVYIARWFRTDTNNLPTEADEILLELVFFEDIVTLLITAARWSVTAGIQLE